MHYDEKTAQLILYLCDRMQSEANFGSVVLNKMLYYIDNVSYLNYKKPISYFTYVKQVNGPTPNPKLFMPLRDRLVGEGKLSLTKTPDVSGKYLSLVPENKVKPDISFFSKEELNVIDNIIIGWIKDKTARELSDHSHKEIGWMSAKIGEEIPYSTYLLSYETPNIETIDWAIKKKKEKYGDS